MDKDKLDKIRKIYDWCEIGDPLKDIEVDEYDLAELLFYVTDLYLKQNNRWCLKELMKIDQRNEVDGN